MEITMKEAQEYFTKLNCDAYNKEELSREIWKRMNSDEREPYFRQLKEMKDDE